MRITVVGAVILVVAALIAAGCGGSDSSNVGRIVFGYGSQVAVMDGDGTDQNVSLTNGSQPSASRSGGKITFIRDNNVYVIDRNGGNLKQVTTIGTDSDGITENDVTVSDPAISPGGTQIAYVVTPVGTGTTSVIHIIDVDGKNDFVLVENATEPNWSPGGTRLVFARGADIYTIIPIEGASPTNVTENSTGVTVADPTFLPTNQRIAYALTPLTTGAVSEIHIVNLDGEDETSFITDATEPTFQPNGERMAFIRGGNVYSVNSSGGDLKQLTTGGISSSPTWTL